MSSRDDKPGVTSPLRNSCFVREFRLSEVFARFRRTIFFGAIFDIIPSAETDQWIADMLSPFMCSTWVAVFSKL